jgi:hypothetical protein
MLKIKIEGDFGKKMLDQLQRDLHPKVLQPAINKVAAKAMAEINRAIPAEYAVKASEVRNAVSLRRAHAGRLEAVIDIFGSAKKRGRSLNLIHFLAAVQAAGKAHGVRGKRLKKSDLAALDGQLGFIIKKMGGVKKIERAFIGNNGRTIFTRTGDARLPIKPLQVIGFSQMFASRKISKRVTDKINAEMPVEIERALKMLMARGW